MTLSEATKFVDKTILKTKNESLVWKTLSPNFELKPIPETNSTLPYGAPTKERLSIKDSYATSFKTGTIVLLVYQEPIAIFSSPPDDCVLSLRIQDNTSKFAVEIANTNTSQMIKSSLIRLYNLIDKNSSSISTLINDFLNG